MGKPKLYLIPNTKSTVYCPCFGWIHNTSCSYSCIRFHRYRKLYLAIVFFAFVTCIFHVSFLQTLKVDSVKRLDYQRFVNSFNSYLIEPRRPVPESPILERDSKTEEKTVDSDFNSKSQKFYDQSNSNSEFLMPAALGIIFPESEIHRTEVFQQISLDQPHVESHEEDEWDTTLTTLSQSKTPVVSIITEEATQRQNNDKGPPKIIGSSPEPTPAELLVYPAKHQPVESTSTSTPVEFEQGHIENDVEIAQADETMLKLAEKDKLSKNENIEINNDSGEESTPIQPKIQPVVQSQSEFSVKKNRSPVMACSIPYLNPFDPSILPLIEQPDPLVCNNTEYPLLFELDDDGTLVQLFDYQPFGFDYCCYLSFTRTLNNDDDFEIQPYCTPITGKRTDIPHNVSDFIVTCREEGKKRKFIDIDVFSIPRLTPSNVFERTQKILNSDAPAPSSSSSSSASRKNVNSNQKLNVVILGLDAVSSMNFVRTMPRSRNYLLGKLSALTFNGYTKVGDNTLPNAMAILTGRSLQEAKETCWRSDEDYFDSCPFIWKNYSALGYYTSYAEDAPDISTFSYMKKGFQNPPVHFYARPSLLSQDGFIGHENLSNGNICYGPRKSFDVLLKYMRNLAFSIQSNSNQNSDAKRSSDEPNKSARPPDFNYFQYIWSNALSHDFDNFPALGDAALLDTLKWFHQNNYLNNTVLILMSDHGMRWGDIRETVQGKIEERMPLLNIVLPPWFARKYPRAYENMVGNKEKLTTHFDFHEVLKDILEPELHLSERSILERSRAIDARQASTGTTPRGISLFLPIPTSRDCPNAGIDPSWCICQHKKTINKNSRQVQEAAQKIIQHLNNKLSGYYKCAKLKLDQVLSAELVIPAGDEGNLLYNQNEAVKEKSEQEGGATGNNGENSFPTEILNMTNREIVLHKQRGEYSDILDLSLDITLRTSPGLALFEASITKNIQNTNKTLPSWNDVGEVSRINLYGNQSHCVNDSKIKLYCFCMDQQKPK